MSQRQCDKVPFWSKVAAKKAMKYLRLRGLRRYYKCSRGAFHVTSDPR